MLSVDGFNDVDLQWIAYDNWTYSRTFTLETNQVNGKTVWLKCDGLDTVATVRYTYIYCMARVCHSS